MTTVDLQDYLRPLWKWWWLLAAATLTAALSSFVYTKLQPATYEARTTVSVGSTIKEANPSGNNVYLAQQLAETYADIAGRTPIRQNTMAALKLTWLPEYEVNALPNTPIIEFKVYDTDAQRAYAVAKELVNQLILQGPAGREEQNRQSFIDDQLTKLQNSIKETEDEITKKQEDLAKIFSAREIVNAQNQITALQNKESTLQANYAALLANTQKGATNALNILEPATVPTEPLSSKLLVNVLIAAMIGFALAAGGAYLLEYLDDSIKATDDIQKLFGVPLLSSIPVIGGADQLPPGPANVTTPDGRLVMLQSIAAPATEAYRLLRTNLQFANVDRALKMVLVTSPSPSEGKSLTAANLSAALARAGKRVILVDADLHRPAQHRLFKLINNMGLTTALLTDGIAIEQLLQKTSVPGLFVLTTGPLPPNPAELLGSRRMQEIVAKLKEQTDFLIFDSPPITAVADSVILASFADAVLMILRAGKTRRDWAKQAFNAMHQVQARVVGVVLNGVTKGSVGYSNYGYYRTTPYALPGPTLAEEPAPREVTSTATPIAVVTLAPEDAPLPPFKPNEDKPSLNVKRKSLFTQKPNPADVGLRNGQNPEH